jgi:hypothetical protein
MYQGQYRKVSLNHYVVDIPAFDLKNVHAKVNSTSQVQLEDGTVFVRI